MLKISIVILTFNNEKTIAPLLNSLLPLKSRFRVVVVDNGSSDETLLQVKKFKFAKVIENKKNLGFSAGGNIGIKFALSSKADVVFLLNPDALVSKDFLINFDKTTKFLLDKNAIVGTKILDENGKVWSVGGLLDKKRYSSILKHKLSSDLDYISGTAVFIKKEVFEKIGFFKEDYFLYYEDVDFCFRAKIAGFKLAVDPNISVVHHPSSSVGKNSPVMQYYMARNHMLFVERFAPMTIKIREFIRMPKTLYQARNKKYELLGITDYFLRRSGRKELAA